LTRKAAQLVSCPHALDGARWPQAFLWSRAGAIVGGTSQVQANIIAQRMLECRDRTPGEAPRRVVLN
jgi:alkylation response protein AidB-like acyl-CoA dehydrogenase